MESSARTGLTLPGPVRILSDLHLGHDMCSLRRVAEIWPLIEGAGTVVFNGDTTEDRAAPFRNRSRDMFGELEALCLRAGARVVLLNGNHDPDTWPHDWLDLADGRLFVTHGHVLLRLVSPWSRKARAFRTALERIHSEYSVEQRAKLETRFDITRRCSLALPAAETRQHGRSFTARAALLLREIWPPGRTLEVLKVWAKLPALASAFMGEFRPSARVMLFGHTHRAAWWRRGGRLLVNTGGFVTFAKPLLAEWHDRKVSIFRIDGRNGERRRGARMACEQLEP